MPENKNQLRNHLRITRKRLGLHQSHIAQILDHKTTDQVSRYENGYRIPGLKILLQLEIIYGLPARVLYREYFEELQEDIQARFRDLNLPEARNGLGENRKIEISPHYCYYEELLRNSVLTSLERDQIRKHLLLLMPRHSELQSGWSF